MECMPLEIKVISAKDLKDVNIITKMDVYVIVSISGDPFFSRQKTPVHKDGGTNPKWNHTLKFTVNQDAVQKNLLSLIFHIKSDRNLGDRDIGEVHVPVKELLDNNGGEKGEHFVSYSVRTASGKAKGILEFSFKFGEIFSGSAPPPATLKKVEEPVMAYPATTTSFAYQYAPPPSGEHPYPAPGGYPPPPVQGYGYPPNASPAYGYPPAGHWYPPAAQQVNHGKKKKKGGNFGLAMGAGLLGGLLLGDMVADAGEMAVDSYDAGVEGALDF